MIKKEFEIVEHARLSDIRLFIVDLAYRNPHMHKEFELCYILSGSLELFSQRQTYLFRAGDYFLLNPKQLHEIHAVDHSRATILSLQISAKFCSRYFPQIQNIEFDLVDINSSLDEVHRVSVTRFLLQLSQFYFRADPFYELQCYALLNNLFHELLIAVPWHSLSEAEKAIKNSNSERLNRVMDYIEGHYSEKILLQTIAEQEGLSLSYLSHFFKDNLNMTFQDYVALLRFEEARKLLEHTKQTITDIGLSCGFSDGRYLNKVFLKKLGCKPSEYKIKYITGLPSSNANTSGTNQRFHTAEESLEMLNRLLKYTP